MSIYTLIRANDLFLEKLRDILINSNACEREWDALYRYSLQEEIVSFVPVLILKALKLLEKMGYKLEDILVEFQSSSDASVDDIKQDLARFLSRSEVDLIK